MQVSIVRGIRYFNYCKVWIGKLKTRELCFPDKMLFELFWIVCTAFHPDRLLRDQFPQLEKTSEIVHRSRPSYCQVKDFHTNLNNKVKRDMARHDLRRILRQLPALDHGTTVWGGGWIAAYYTSITESLTIVFNHIHARYQMSWMFVFSYSKVIWRFKWLCLRLN